LVAQKQKKKDGKKQKTINFAMANKESVEEEAYTSKKPVSVDNYIPRKDNYLDNCLQDIAIATGSQTESVPFAHKSQDKPLTSELAE